MKGAVVAPCKIGQGRENAKRYSAGIPENQGDITWETQLHQRNCKEFRDSNAGMKFMINMRVNLRADVKIWFIATKFMIMVMKCYPVSTTKIHGRKFHAIWSLCWLKIVEMDDGFFHFNTMRGRVCLSVFLSQGRKMVTSIWEFTSQTTTKRLMAVTCCMKLMITWCLVNQTSINYQIILYV